MSQFVFSNTTTVYFGKEKLHNIINEIRHYGKRILLVTGKRSAEKNAAFAAVSEYIHKAAEKTVPFTGVMPNPTTEQIDAGIMLCRRERCDLIIAIGGGSVIDASKAMAAGVHSDTDSIWDIVTNQVPVHAPLPVIAIPTTAATGSEMNAGAVITCTKQTAKRGFGHPSLQPVAAFYVPEFTYSLPPFQTACGCVDIISHILDSGYITAHHPMKMLHEIQGQVLHTVFTYASTAVHDGNHAEARENLLWASAWALNGFMYENLQQDPVLHIIEHQLSAEYGITHGHGIAVLLPRWLKYILSDKTAEAITELGIRAMGLPSSDDIYRDAEATIDAFEHYFVEALQLDLNLSHFCNYQTDTDRLAARICQGRSLESIVSLTEKDVCAILKSCG